MAELTECSKGKHDGTVAMEMSVVAWRRRQVRLSLLRRLYQKALSEGMGPLELRQDESDGMVRVALKGPKSSGARYLARELAKSQALTRELVGWLR